MTDFDVIVVGSGPGGAITAKEFASAGLQVAVFERGGEGATVDEFGLSDLLKHYKHAGMTSFLGRHPISYVEASVLGGGSVINAGLYHRTPDSKLNEWINSGCLNLTRQNVELLQKKVEEFLRLETTPHELITEGSLKLAEGAKLLNWECVNVPRWYSHCRGVAKKNSMNELVHNSLRNNPNVKYFINTEVTKLTEGKFGVSVDYKDTITNNRECTSGRYIFLCAGAIDTPNLLKKSGYLSGRNILIGCHPSAKIVATYSEELKVCGDSIGPHQIKEFYPDFTLGCSVSSPAYVMQAMIGSCDRDISNRELRSSAVYYANIESSENRLYSVPFLRNPILKAEMGQNDFVRLKRGLVELARVLFAAGAVELRLSAECINRSSSFSEFVEFIDHLSTQYLNLMTIHLFASLPMGPQKSHPIAYGGRLKEASRIYVNDASIFPSPIGANPQGTVLMLALNNARMFLREKT